MSQHFGKTFFQYIHLERICVSTFLYNVHIFNSEEYIE